MMNIEVWKHLAQHMRVEQLNEDMWAMTYLVECDSTKKVALIDPVWDNLSDYLVHH